MKANKVTFNGEPIIDLTQDTAVEADVAVGKTFHKADGSQGTGTKPEPTFQDKTVTENGTVTPDEGFDGLSSVEVNVEGSGGEGGNGEPIEVDTLPTENIQEGAIYHISAKPFSGVACYANDQWFDFASKMTEQAGASDITVRYFEVPTRPTENIEFIDESTKTLPLYYIKNESDIFIFTPQMQSISFGLLMNTGTFGGEIADISKATDTTKYYAICQPESYYKYTDDAWQQLRITAGTKTITENGSHDIADYDSVNVDVQPNLQEKTSTANGEVTADEGFDGLSRVVVDVDVDTDIYIKKDCLSSVGIVMPDDATDISEYTNGVETIVTSIEVSDAITEIEAGKLSGFSKLESITLPFVGGISQAKPNYQSPFGYIFGSSEYDGSVSITQSGLSKPTSVTVVSYGYYLPSGLKSVTIKGGVIVSYAFSGCTIIEKITLADNVTSIEYDAFGYCTSLSEIVIGSGVTSIRTSAFIGCTALKSIVMKSTTPPTMVKDYSYYNSSLIITVPYSEDHSVLAAYQAADGWSTHAAQMVEEPAPETA